MANRQASLHYSRHHLAASVTTWLRTRTRQPVTMPCLPIVSWPKSKSSKFSYGAEYAPLKRCDMSKVWHYLTVSQRL